MFNSLFSVLAHIFSLGTKFARTVQVQGEIIGVACPLKIQNMIITKLGHITPMTLDYINNVSWLDMQDEIKLDTQTHFTTAWMLYFNPKPTRLKNAWSRLRYAAKISNMGLVCSLILCLNGFCVVNIFVLLHDEWDHDVPLIWSDVSLLHLYQLIISSSRYRDEEQRQSCCYHPLLWIMIKARRWSKKCRNRDELILRGLLTMQSI